MIPEWVKSIGGMIIFMIIWDIIRIPIQAYVNRKFMKKDFDEIDEALDDVEEAMDEENDNG